MEYLKKIIAKLQCKIYGHKWKSWGWQWRAPAEEHFEECKRCYKRKQ